MSSSSSPSSSWASRVGKATVLPLSFQQKQKQKKHNELITTSKQIYYDEKKDEGKSYQVFVLHQENAGGWFQISAKQGIGCKVAFECRSWEEAVYKAEKIGIVFDRFNDDGECRWDSAVCSSSQVFKNKHDWLMSDGLSSFPDDRYVKLWDELFCFHHKDNTIECFTNSQIAEYKRNYFESTSEIGYKAFDSDWKCRGMQYKVGETFTYEGVEPIELCERGLHYCTNPLFVNKYYSPDAEPLNKYAKVKAFGKRIGDQFKIVAQKLEILEEIPFPEWVKLCTEKEYLLNACKVDNNILHYCNKQMVLAAVKQCGFSLLYANLIRQWDRDIVLAAVQQNGLLLRCVRGEHTKNKDIVLAAVKQDGNALLFAHDELKNDKEVVVAAVQQKSSALVYASAELRKDMDIVAAAVEKNGHTLYVADDKLKFDREFILVAIKRHASLFWNACDESETDNLISQLTSCQA